ncbi:MAG TPA: histidine phosphatase family protein [Chloroflexia bacterium]|nr:histidine phosphatase family protein [Chloroflexia bacterium]
MRHTEVHNPGEILYGRMPRFRLSELGRRQAEATAEVLSGEPLAAIFSSPQLRARQTAKAIAARHPDMKVHITKILAEVVTGWQGRPYSDLHAIEFDFYSHPVNPDDETVAQLWNRVRSFVDMARRKYYGQQVVGVTHGDLNFVARAGYLGMPVAVDSIRQPHLYPGHGAITRLTFERSEDTYPVSVEYCDPNKDDPRWRDDWFEVPKQGLLVRG